MKHTWLSSSLLVVLLFLCLSHVGAGRKDFPRSARADSPEKSTNAGKGSDGIPCCPDSVNNTSNGADVLMHPALKQATTWHQPTPAESASMVRLIKDLKTGDSAQILSNADSLKLQVCRNRNGDDSYLILYTKPGVTDYSGPFIMFREKNATPIIMQAPHNWNGDHTEGATQLAFQNTRCLAYMSNGHPRTLSGDQSPKRPRYESDFAHSSSGLAWVAFKAFETEFPNSIFIQFHGMAAKGMLICDAAKSVRGQNSLFDAFLAGAKYAARNKNQEYRDSIKEWNSNVFICGSELTKDPEDPTGKRKKNNNRWIGIEMGITTSYLNGSQVVPDIIKYLENGYLRDRPLQKSP